MRRPLPYTDQRHQQAHQFLVEEAALLDAHDLDSWLALLTDDVRYRMPVRVSAARASGHDKLTMSHFDEDRYSLGRRVARFSTEHAWTEDPPSRLRHLVTNVRTFDAGGDDLEVESSLLLFRSRGDSRPAEWVAAGRRDHLRATPAGYRLSAREIDVEESVLRTQNLAIFL